MAHSLSKLYIHIIFHVKSNSPLIRSDDFSKLYAVIGNLLNNNNCKPICINGVYDHVHILCVLPRHRALSEIMQRVKSLSSQWIKTIDPYYHSFSWQGGYGAFSVSSSVFEKVVQYINNQQEHHERLTIQEEYKRFLDEYQIEYNDKLLWK